MSEAMPSCRIIQRPAEEVLEFVAYAWPAHGRVSPDWPLGPGAVRRDAQQQPALLHFAPGRWLAPAPAPELRRLLEGAAVAGAGSLIDAGGKWVTVDIAGAGAARLLACTLDIEAVLSIRDCAAVTLFDCPAVVARVAQDFRLWVQASYAAHLLATARECGAGLGYTA
jgi:heterotetrameric sarcosine oxidase gamma subunit